jgi:hypothetical protein
MKKEKGDAKKAAKSGKDKASGGASTAGTGTAPGKGEAPPVNRSFDDVEHTFKANQREFKREYGDVWKVSYLTAIATWLVVVVLAANNCLDDTCGLSLLMTTGAFIFVMVSLFVAHWVSKRHFPMNNAWIDAVGRSQGLSPYTISFFRLWLRRKGFVTLEEAKRFMVSERRHQKQRVKEEAWRPPVKPAKDQGTKPPAEQTAKPTAS